MGSSLLLSIGLVLTLLTNGGEAAPDPCMRRLTRILVPVCTQRLCTDECCLALAFAGESACTADWAAAYENEATIIRRRMHRKCESHCETRARCTWSDRYVDSPCYAADCLSLFKTTVMSPECANLTAAYCHRHLSQVSAIFDDRDACTTFLDTRTRGTHALGASVMHFSMMMAPLNESSLSDECRTDYDEWNSINVETVISRLCYDVVKDACDQSGNCTTCLVPEFSYYTPNLTTLIPCQFNNCDLTPTTDPEEVAGVVVFSFVSSATFALRVWEWFLRRKERAVKAAAKSQTKNAKAQQVAQTPTPA